MRILKIDFTKCKDCDNCESLLPGFRTRNGGIIKIDDSAQDEDMRAAADRVKQSCPNDAIVLTKY